MTKRERAMFRAAKAVSMLSDHRQFKIGCVLEYKHRIIGSGYNSMIRTDRIQAILDREKYGVECPGKLHAEADCLIPFIKRNVNLSGASIYVHRQHKDGSLAMSRPCPSCMKLIKQCGIRRIYYSSNDGYIKEDLDV